jgi:hypothetical protein
MNYINNMAILEFLLVIGLGGFVGLLIVNNVNEGKQKTTVIPNQKKQSIFDQ